MDFPTDTTPPAGNDTLVTLEAPSKRPGIWSGLGIVVLYVVLQALLGIVAFLAWGIVSALNAVTSNHGFDLNAAGRIAPPSPEIVVIIAAASIFVAAAVTAAIVYRIWPAQWSHAELPGFGFVQTKDKRFYLVAVVLGVALVFLSGPLTHLFAGSHPVHQDITVLARKVPMDLRVLLAFAAVCVAPCVEELVFRGVLLSGLARRMHIGWAVLASAVIFGCAHLPDFKFEWYPVPALALTGLVLAWIRLKSRSLWPSITLHATNNFVAVLAWFFVSHHP